MRQFDHHKSRIVNCRTDPFYGLRDAREPDSEPGRIQPQGHNKRDEKQIESMRHFDPREPHCQLSDRPFLGAREPLDLGVVEVPLSSPSRPIR
jgi:hypothetical protein